ncbi:hypothetical protein OROHE_009845 [Orobanche hederae]
MGGGDHHHADGAHGGDFRAKVWSMTGGPNCRPKHWKRNTAFAMFGIVLICIPIAMKSAELEKYGGSGGVISFREVLQYPLGTIHTTGRSQMYRHHHHQQLHLNPSYVRVSEMKMVSQLWYPIDLEYELHFVSQRPHMPVRPIPSQIWCKNFGNKDY